MEWSFSGKKMNVAVILDQKINAGGGFQQSLSIMELLSQLKLDGYNFIFLTTHVSNLVILNNYGVHAHHFNLSLLDIILCYVRRNVYIQKVIQRTGVFTYNRFDAKLRKFKIDLIYFLSPSMLALMTEAHSYIFTVWDLCHRDFVEFPEIRKFREFERREYLNKSALPKAVRVIVDSEYGKYSLIRRYNIDAQRVIVLPFFPSVANPPESQRIDIKAKYYIDGDFIFYPAQFWPHKNHLYIIEGLRVLSEKYNKIIHTVFTGFDKGNLEFILRKARELGVDKQVHYIGFVDHTEISCLYKQALALVMPTYFGPTNIPPLEAFKLGCPVLYPDLPCLREQVEGAALLINIKNPESLAVELLRLIDRKVDVNTLVENGYKKAESWKNEDYWLGIKSILDDYAFFRKLWDE
jgi:glycosyltransferase involved in cell wall biosynthesis